MICKASLLIIIFFAIGCVQAAGSDGQTANYEVISAEHIHTDINAGKNIKLDYIIVNGTLDLSGLEDPIKGEITITNSIINGPVNLAGKTFKKKVDFSGTAFLDEVTLSDSQQPAFFEIMES